MLRKSGRLILCVSLGLCAAGCPKGHVDYGLGEKAENLQDYDAALNYYQKAVKSAPHNATFRIRLNQARFEAGEMHVKRGVEMRKRGNSMALSLNSRRPSQPTPRALSLNRN